MLFSVYRDMREENLTSKEKKPRAPRKMWEYVTEVVFFACAHLLVWPIFFIFFSRSVIDKLGYDVEIAGRETIYRYGVGFFEYTMVPVAFIIFIVIALLLKAYYKESAKRMIAPAVLHAVIFVYQLVLINTSGHGPWVREFFFQMYHKYF